MISVIFSPKHLALEAWMHILNHSSISEKVCYCETHDSSVSFSYQSAFLHKQSASKMDEYLSVNTRGSYTHQQQH